MESTPKMSREEFIDRMRQKVEEVLGKVADAVNEAPPGQIIAGSEEQVRDLFADLRRRAFEMAVQMRRGCGGSRFSPLRRTRPRTRPSAIRGARTTPC